MVLMLLNKENQVLKWQCNNERKGKCLMETIYVHCFDEKCHNNPINEVYYIIMPCGIMGMLAFISSINYDPSSVLTWKVTKHQNSGSCELVAIIIHLFYYLDDSEKCCQMLHPTFDKKYYHNVLNHDNRCLLTLSELLIANNASTHLLQVPWII